MTFYTSPCYLKIVVLGLNKVRHHLAIRLVMHVLDHLIPKCHILKIHARYEHFIAGHVLVRITNESMESLESTAISTTNTIQLVGILKRVCIDQVVEGHTLGQDVPTPKFRVRYKVQGEPYWSSTKYMYLTSKLALKISIHVQVQVHENTQNFAQVHEKHAKFRSSTRFLRKN